MSALDRAFIKAYRDDPQRDSPTNAPARHPATVVPAPHAQQFFRQVSAQTPADALATVEPIVIERSPPRAPPAIAKSFRIDVAQPLGIVSQTPMDQSPAQSRRIEIDFAAEPAAPQIIPTAPPIPVPQTPPVGPATSLNQAVSVTMPQVAKPSLLPPIAPLQITPAAHRPTASSPLAGANSAGSGLASLSSRIAALAPAATTAATILPLSAFRSDPVEVPFRAALEVDHFAWPAECDTLLQRAERGFDESVKQIRQAIAAGQKTVAITSCRAGEGRTTLALSLAKRLASAGFNVVLIDAHFARPELTSRLGLAVDSGWEAVLSGESEVADVLIESLTDRLSVLPLARPLAIETFNRNLRGTTMLGMLRQHFDIALLDASALDAAGRPALDALIASGQLQAALLVRDIRRTSQSDVQAIEQRLAAAGVNCLGVAENFCTT